MRAEVAPEFTRDEDGALRAVVAEGVEHEEEGKEKE